MVDKSELFNALHHVKDPEMEKDIVELGFVPNVQLEGEKAIIHFAPDLLECPFIEWFKAEIEQAVLKIDGINLVEVNLIDTGVGNPLEKGELPFGGIEHLNQVKKIVAIMSGKGGVGKSLVAGMLAVTLMRSQYKVGILDADITGPSIPKMFFTRKPLLTSTPRAILPATSKNGIKVMSVNFLLERDDEAIIWRGPLIGRAIKQFWTDTLWGNLDYLIIDLPPGTSDAPLTVMQSLPMSGVLLVTSPQDLAGMVVRKSASMVQHIGVPILGLVENMSFYKAPDTGVDYEVFGPSHAETTARALNIPVVARLPINANIAMLCDQGKVEECEMPEFESVKELIEKVTPLCSAPKMPV